MSKLNSEYVVKIYKAWTEAEMDGLFVKNHMFIQMELCAEDLDSLIDKIKMNRLNEENFIEILYFLRSKILVEIIECLNYLHSSNPPIIHRDLKPKNILISNEMKGRILKLCDFGVSKFYQNTNNTEWQGTKKYMAPEVKEDMSDEITSDKSESDDVHGGKRKVPYNFKCDIYSLGIIAKELFEINNM